MDARNANLILGMTFLILTFMGLEMRDDEKIRNRNTEIYREYIMDNSDSTYSMDNIIFTIDYTSRTTYGIASYYAHYFHRRPTACGELFDMYGMTAAHRTLPLGTILLVTNKRTRKSVIVEINDRGPYIDGRVLDLSYGAAEKLDMLYEGLDIVEMIVLKIGDRKYAKQAS